MVHEVEMEGRRYNYVVVIATEIYNPPTIRDPILETENTEVAMREEIMTSHGAAV
jgi:hypothetical protein